MNLLGLGAAVLLSVSVFACGGDAEEPPPEPIPRAIDHPSVELATRNAFRAIVDLGATNSSETAAIALIDFGIASTDFAVPASEGSRVDQAQSAESIQQALGDAGCECAATSCTFTECDTGRGYIVTGSIEWSDTSLRCAYAVSGNGGESSVAFNMLGNLTFGTTSLDGTFTTTGNAASNGEGPRAYKAEFDASVNFKQVVFELVTLESNGATSVTGPTGGRMQVSSWTTTNGQKFGASESIDF